jgi:hypothetical protein
MRVKNTVFGAVFPQTVVGQVFFTTRPTVRGRTVTEQF